MPEKSGFYVAACLSVLSIIALPGFAQHQRYPTEAEIRRLSATLPESIASLEGVGITDKRSKSEIETLNSFIRNWSQVNPTVAPFLGERTTWGTVMVIYPSNVRNRLCIITLDWDEPDYIDFTQAYVSNSQIRTDAGSIIIRDKAFLGVIYIQDNEAMLSAYHVPKPLKPIPQLLNGYPSAIKNRITQQFNAAGCTASRPARR
ncbi:MAG TPA: hypothetical protein V6D28_08420 [Leptolyngbyaceae cyanobacterium]